MTDTEEASPDTTDASGRSRKLLIFAIIAVVLVAAVAIAVWYFLIRDDSAASVDSSEAAEARQEALDEAAGDADASVADAEDGVAADEDIEAGDEEAAAEGDDATVAPVSLDGTWNIDNSIGTFDEVCLTDVCDTTFVGFRIDEELARVGAKTVVGRTPGVTGTMELAGTTITATEIAVDMTQLITDSSSRTNAIRRQAVETTAFPDASFVLTEPVELGALPAEGEQVAIEATGDLTIHGVTRSETIPLTAELAGDVIVVFGQLGPILLSDYNIAKPTAAVVLSVEDNAIMELQLFLTRPADL